MNATILERSLKGETLTDVLIIDWHVHLGTWPVMHMPNADEAMIAAMDRVGVDRICVNGAICSDVREGNDRVADFARRFPDHVIPVAFLNPYQVDLLEEFGRCVNDLGMKSLKLHSMIQGSYSPPLRSAAYDWDGLWEECARLRVPVLAHGVVTDQDIERHPETTFVLAHSVSSLDRLTRLAACGNAYTDTASTQNKAWSVSEAVGLIGADRILWGTDAPLDDFAQRLGVALDSGLSEEDQRNILGLNAARLLGLDL